KGGIYFYNDWRSQTPWGDTRPDYGRPEVRDYILDNATMWLADFHLDGLRLDSTIYMRNVHGNNNDPDNDLPDGWHLLQDITERARKVNYASILIAEDVGSNEYITKSVNDGGAGFNTQWDVIFPETIKSLLTPPDDDARNLDKICE